MKTGTEKQTIKRLAGTIVVLATMIYVPLSLADVLDSGSTAEKAAKSAAAKTTVGVGGRCSPADAAKDTAKKVTGIEGKVPSGNRATGLAKGAVKKAVK